MTQSNEQYLRRFGADLHDGPAQLVSLAIMRLGDFDDTIQTRRGNQRTGRTHTEKPSMTVRNVLSTALTEMRNIASGLVLPEIDDLTIQVILATVIARHEKLTQTIVDLDCKDLPSEATTALKVCIYRFIQEGLSNAYRYGGGVDQTVTAHRDSDTLVLIVSDRGRMEGTGERTVAKSPGQGLGLPGLTARIECLGGTLTFESAPNQVTRLTAHLPLAHPQPESMPPNER